MGRTLVASDNFNRANGNIGSDWLYTRLTSWQGTPPAIKSNVVIGRAAASNFQTARWAGSGTFSNDQYSKAAIGGLAFWSGDFRGGVTVRDNGGIDTAANCYGVQVYSDSSGPNYTTLVFKIVAGTFTSLNSASRAWVNGDTVELEIIGTTLTAFKNGVSFFSVTDTSLASGKPGITVAGDGNTLASTIDSWEGGDVSNGTIISCTVGDASAVGLTAVITTSSGTTINCTVGDAAAAGATAAVSNFIKTPPLENNTESGPLASTAVSWSWLPNWRAGDALTSFTGSAGTGTTDAQGCLTTTIAATPGTLIVNDLGADATLDAIFLKAYK